MTEFNIESLLSEVSELLTEMIPNIIMWSEDEREVWEDTQGLYQDEDSDNNEDSDKEDFRYLQLTIGYTINDDCSFFWDYQTGDNCYTGGTYFHKEPWLVTEIYPGDLADDVITRLRENYNSIMH